MTAVFVVGYQPKPFIPLDDYTDFPIGRKFTLEDIDIMTDQGVLPPGLILQAKGTLPVVVKGNYDEIQSVEIMRI